MSTAQPRWLLVHLLHGAVLDAHRRLVRDVADRFGVRFELERGLPSHLTFKFWFTAQEPERITQLLEDIAAAHRPLPIRYHGFGHFGRSVVFVRIEPSRPVAQLTEQLTASLQQIPWMTWAKNEQGERHLHATIARVDIRKRFEEMWQYLNEQEFAFSSSLDALALLARRDGYFVVERTFSLRG